MSDGERPDVSPGDRNRIVEITLDERLVVRRSPEVEHECAVAVYDLIEENCFAVRGDFPGPYRVRLKLEDNRLILDVTRDDGEPPPRIVLPMTPFRSLIKDYFMVCESYFAAIKTASPSRIEAIDMGRRGLHNEGAKILQERLAERVEMDFDTARRLFTLVCVLHIRG